jgi:hypothetical protein
VTATVTATAGGGGGGGGNDNNTTTAAMADDDDGGNDDIGRGKDNNSTIPTQEMYTVEEGGKVHRCIGVFAQEGANKNTARGETIRKTLS